MTSAPLAIGLGGSALVAAGVAALRTILRPPDLDGGPPSDDAAVVWRNDPAAAVAFAETWRYVAVVGVGAAVQLTALAWQAELARRNGDGAVPRQAPWRDVRQD